MKDWSTTTKDLEYYRRWPRRPAPPHDGDLDIAKHYFRERYAEAPDARYGLVASSRDKSLQEWGIPNDWHSTQRMNLGPWYGEGEGDQRSCRHLRECVTEFGAQGLELDATTARLQAHGVKVLG